MGWSRNTVFSAKVVLSWDSSQASVAASSLPGGQSAAAFWGAAAAVSGNTVSSRAAIAVCIINRCVGMSHLLGHRMDGDGRDARRPDASGSARGRAAAVARLREKNILSVLPKASPGRGCFKRRRTAG